MPAFLLFKKKHGDVFSSHDSGSQLVSSDTTVSDTEATDLTTQREVSNSTMTLRYDLLFPKAESSECDDASGSNESSRRYSDDNGFFSETEDNASDAVDTNNAKPGVSYFSDNQGIYRQEGAVSTQCNNCSKGPSCHVTFEALEGQTVDTQSTKALLNASPALPLHYNFTRSWGRTSDTGIPIDNPSPKDVHHWYVVVSRLTMKEKLTRRQLFQIAGMTFLGFIFVGLIIVWVFSPILF